MSIPDANIKTPTISVNSVETDSASEQAYWDCLESMIYNLADSQPRSVFTSESGFTVKESVASSVIWVDQHGNLVIENRPQPVALVHFMPNGQSEANPSERTTNISMAIDGVWEYIEEVGQELLPPPFALVGVTNERMAKAAGALGFKKIGEVSVSSNSFLSRKGSKVTGHVIVARYEDMVKAHVGLRSRLDRRRLYQRALGQLTRK